VADARDRLDHLLYDYRSLTSNSQIWLFTETYIWMYVWYYLHISMLLA
jgi:hypothetical protein